MAWSIDQEDNPPVLTIRRKGVTLYRRTGGLKRVIITPDDPEDVVEIVSCHERFSQAPGDPSE